MEFNFDERKSTGNKRKHGIDFIEAQRIWADPDRVEIPARTEDEPRFLVIGKIGERLWSAVITYRDNKTRLISARPARPTEKKIYESD